MEYLKYLLLWLGWTTSQDAINFDIHKNFTISSQYQLQVENHNGKVSVDAHDSNELIINAQIIDYQGTKSAADIITCTLQEKAGCTIVHCTTELNNSTFGLHKNSPEVHYTILVPRKDCQLIDIQTHNGAIRTEAISGMQFLKTHNGAIIANSSDGRIEAKTHNGSITVQNPKAPFDLTTHNGPITTTVTQKIVGNCSACTHNGSVNISKSKLIDGKINATTKNGSVCLS